MLIWVACLLFGGLIWAIGFGLCFSFDLLFVIARHFGFSWLFVFYCFDFGFAGWFVNRYLLFYFCVCELVVGAFGYLFVVWCFFGCWMFESLILGMA